MTLNYYWRIDTIPVIILAGGKGTRFREQTESRPKPLIEVGGRPIVRHLIDYYRGYGFTKFVLACGHRGDQIKRYFTDTTDYTPGVEVRFASDGKKITWDGTGDLDNNIPWSVECMNTGENTLTAGRVFQVLRRSWWGCEHVALTYGDGLSDVDLFRLVDQHHFSGKVGTVTAVHPPPRFGELVLDGDAVTQFSEKPIQQSWINGGFFVFRRKELTDFLYELDAEDHCNLDEMPFEGYPLQTLAARGQLGAFRHEGFWQCMDTARDHEVLERIWGESMPWEVPWAGKRRTR